MSSQEEHNKLTDEKKIQIDWILQRKQRIMGHTGDNKKPKSAERGTSEGHFQSRSWKKIFMH